MDDGSHPMPLVFFPVGNGICLVSVALADFGGFYCNIVLMCSNLTAARLVN
jgi:hypothetical protein